MECRKLFHIHHFDTLWKRKIKVNKQTKSAAARSDWTNFSYSLSDVQVFWFMCAKLFVLVSTFGYAVKTKSDTLFSVFFEVESRRDIQISWNTLMTYFRMRNFPQDCLNEVANYLKSHALASVMYVVRVECCCCCCCCLHIKRVKGHRCAHSADKPIAIMW